MTHITYNTETQALLSRPAITEAKSLFLRAAQALWVWQSRADSRNALAKLDDHMLEDIGLTRADVMRETRKPFWAA